MIPAAAYLRVSSEMQVDIGSSIPSQLAAIEEYAANNGYAILPEHVYTDEAQSARTADRPEFQRMISVAKKDKPPFKAILCYENSRFARSREDSVLFKAMLRRRGIKLCFVKQDFADDPAGRMMEGIIESVDQWYSENLGIETRRGQQQNAKDGYCTGGRPPYGLRPALIKNEHGKNKTVWEPDPDTAPIVQRIYDLYVQGQGYKKIAYALNADGVPSPSGGDWAANTMYYILLKNQPAYLGKLIYGREKNSFRRDGVKFNAEGSWTVKDNAWAPIITQQQADAVNAIFGKRRPRKTAILEPVENDDVSSPGSYALTGMLFCGLCGAAMVGDGGGNAHKYYRCTKNRASGAAKCALPALRQDVIENTVADLLREKLTSKKFLEKIYHDLKEEHYGEPEQAKKQLQNAEAVYKRKAVEKQRLVLAVAHGTMTEEDIRPTMQKISSELLAQESVISALRQEITDTSLSIKDFQDFRRSVTTIINLNQALKCLIQQFVEKIEVFPNKLVVTFSCDLDNEIFGIKMAESRGFEPLRP